MHEHAVLKKAFPFLASTEEALFHCEKQLGPTAGGNASLSLIGAVTEAEMAGMNSRRSFGLYAAGVIVTVLVVVATGVTVIHH
jgi:hypothetical protein